MTDFDDLNPHLAGLATAAPAPTHAIDRIPTFRAGVHRDREYTPADLDDMVRNFELASSGDDPLLRVPLVIGHDESQELLARSDLPAAGWVRGLVREGDTLYADVEDVADLPARLIRARRYRKVSAEVYDEPPAGLEGCRGKVLRRVALLGGDIPEVKGLADIPMPRAYSESLRLLDAYRRPVLVCGHAEPIGSGLYEVFSEVRYGMDRQNLLDRLARFGYDLALLTDAVPDSVLAEMVRVADSQDQAADRDGDGEADSTQYVPPGQPPMEAQPPVESVKDGAAIPEKGFAEEDEPPHQGRLRDRAGRAERAASRYEYEHDLAAPPGAGQSADARTLRDISASLRRKGRAMYGRDSGFAENEPTPEAVRQAVDQMTLRRQMARPSRGRPGSLDGGPSKGKSPRALEGGPNPAPQQYDDGGSSDARKIAALLARAGFAPEEAMRMAQAACRRGGYALHTPTSVHRPGDMNEGCHAEGDGFTSPKASRSYQSNVRRLHGLEGAPLEGGYEEFLRREHRDAEDVRRGVERREHPALEGFKSFDDGRDLGREERIRSRQRRLAAAQRGQYEGFGETQVRREEGGSMAQGNAPSLAAVIDRAVSEGMRRVRDELKKELLDGIHKDAAEAKATFQAYAEQRLADERARAVDAFLEQMSMGEDARLTPAQREVERALGLAADGKRAVRKFSENGVEVEQTAYDLWREGIKARPKLCLFSELAGTDGEGDRAKAADREEAKLLRHFSETAADWKARGVASGEALVEMFRVERKVRADATADEFLGNQ